MRRSNVVVLAVAILLGAIAAVLARNWLVNHSATSIAQGRAGTIVVAATSLAFGTQLSAENIKEIPWSATALPEGAFATSQELFGDGRRMALASIARNVDLVDVILIRTEAESRSKEGYSDVILQSAKVLAIDQITGERPEQPTIAPGWMKPATPRTSSTRTVTARLPGSSIDDSAAR
jgi:pilus assembly protein CpaB